MPYANHPCPGCSRPVSNRFEMCRACRNASNTGANNPNWRGGISTNRYRYKRIQVARYPERDLARQAVRYAIRAGNIKKPAVCEWAGCAETNLQAHHWTYQARLRVNFFCRRHHQAVDSLTSWWSTHNMSNQPLPEDDITLYYWQGHLLLPDGAPFEMGGVLVQPVIAQVDDPCFRTEPRPNRPSQATRYGWVRLGEMEEINAAQYRDLLENWQAAIREVDQLEQIGAAPSTLGGAYEIERLAGQSLADAYAWFVHDISVTR